MKSILRKHQLDFGGLIGAFLKYYSLVLALSPVRPDRFRLTAGPNANTKKCYRSLRIPCNKKTFNVCKLQISKLTRFNLFQIIFLNPFKMSTKFDKLKKT
jgi:hypothetical protein